MALNLQDGSAKGKGRGKQQQTKQGGAGSAVQTQNGQADSLSLSSGILQVGDNPRQGLPWAIAEVSNL